MTVAGRSVTVTLGANVSGFISGMRNAAAAVDSVTSKMAKSARDNTQEWNTVGSTLTRVGAVAAAGLGFAAKSAMDWESAWAGVRKTVDQTSPAFATLESDLRGMARTMATSHTEIAAVAESAGALGVATEDVASFTRTMIMLGETTNLTAEEAADSLAQFMNVMGTAPDQVGNLGAALVALGNDGASTERQIVQMAQRIAGAGKQIGLSEAEVMGFASAMASVGIEVEAGGTAISSTMLKMEQAVRNGGVELELLAETAGMSSEQFKTAFETDAAGAINAFVQGLGRVQETGGDVTGILTDLGITGIREADTLRRLASSGDMLADSLGTAGQAMSEGSALLNEYMERANTTEARVAVAWNNIKDAAISAGQSLLPVVASISQGVAELAQRFGSLDPAVLALGATITAVIAVLGLLGGSAIKAITGLVELRGALVAIGATNAAGALGKLGSALVAVGRYAAPAALALGALVVIDKIRNSAEQAVPTLNEMTAAVMRLAEAGQDLQSSGIDQMLTSSTFDDAEIAVGRIDGLADAFARLESNVQADQIAMWWDRNIGIGQSSQATLASEAIGKLDQSMVKLIETGKIGLAQESFLKIAAESGLPISELANKYFPEYRAALERTAEALDVTGLSNEELARWMGGEVPAAVQQAAAGMKGASGPAGDLAKQLDAAGSAARQMAADLLSSANAMLQLSGSQMGVEAAIDAATESLKENGKTLDIGTEKGRANQAALDNIAGAALRLAQSQAEAGKSSEEINASMDRNRESFIKAAESMGMNTEEARRMADQYGLVGSQVAGLAGAASQITGPMMEAAAAVGNLSLALAAVPVDKTVTVSAPGVPETQTQVVNLADTIRGVPDDHMVTITLPNGDVVMQTAAEVRASIEQIPASKTAMLAIEAAAGKEEIVTFQTMVDATTGKTVTVGTISDLNGQVRTQIAVDNTTGKVVTLGTQADLRGVNAARNGINSVNNKTVTITTVYRTVGQAVSGLGAYANAAYRRADGGLITPHTYPAGPEFAGAQRLSVGGMVAGWSPHARADNVPIWATANEVMMSNAAGDLYGRNRLLALNSRRVDPAAFAAFMSAQGLADGGAVKAKESFARAPQYYPTAPVSGSSAVAQRVVNQEYNIFYPVAERQSQATRKAAAQGGVEAML